MSDDKPTAEDLVWQDSPSLPRSHGEVRELYGDEAFPLRPDRLKGPNDRRN